MFLDLKDLHPDPLQQFQLWFDEFKAACPVDPEAMALATADAHGQPTVRTVLMRGLDADGFQFFTHYEGRKGRELEANPRAGLLFYWRETARQVRVEGTVERVSLEISDAYFQSRPRVSQVGAWASAQSQPLESRQALLDRVAELEKRFGDGPVPRPDRWGGYRVRPVTWEFWQHGEFRLHDRFLYQREGGGWSITRLNP